jgi:site-specific recombinase XerD
MQDKCRYLAFGTKAMNGVPPLAVAVEPERLGAVSPPAQADSDQQFIELWVAQSISRHTRRVYRRRAADFLAHVGRRLADVRLGDVQAYLATLEGLAAVTRATAMAVLKSLFSFAQRTGYVRFNIGSVLKGPPVKNRLAERILSEPDTLRMIALERNARNSAILTVLYGAGLRISEACGLRWCDLQERDEAGQATVYGKGGKTRVVLLSANAWRVLAGLRGSAGPDDPVFRSRNGGLLDVSQVHRMVKGAARRAGISAAVSAHWLRHAHASHSLERGAPIHLVQATLGHASVATTGRYLHARPSDSSGRYLAV